MNKEFYEFLFHLRASGFLHNSRENSRMILYRNSQPAEKKTPFTVSADRHGEVTGNNLQGEMGSFSYVPSVNYRNTLIGVAFALNMHSMDKFIDIEVSGALTDYYIAQAETVSTAEEFNRVMTEMTHDFYELSHSKAWESYGQPIDSCIDYVYRNLYAQITVTDIAKQLGYNESYLSTLFKEKTGQSLYTFIIETKIQEARVLLLYTSQTLTNIASALGYHSLSHFSKIFKEKEGCTPLQYRKKGSTHKPEHFYGNTFLSQR